MKAAAVLFAAALRGGSPPCRAQGLSPCCPKGLASPLDSVVGFVRVAASVTDEITSLNATFSGSPQIACNFAKCMFSDPTGSEAELSIEERAAQRVAKLNVKRTSVLITFSFKGIIYL